jgi:hypothetical protein
MSTKLLYLSNYITDRDDSALKFSEFIERRSDMITLIPESCCMEIYKDEIAELLVTAELSETEQIKYKYNPKLLSYHLYGTAYMSKTILDLNNLKHPGEFDLETITFINPSSDSIYELKRIISVYQEKFMS